ncbi:hypothetical protein Poli38472_008002 [Pythium oligandrum]|uniref:Peptidase M14 domain-containing protein n=1 Tax=Pythium oligandrum TaxID=41045 RepID=A0A8K1CMJ5_PYTOL|nr:hypothetical protein Poli38472_008002 [Pythium oligandrum]|eukprot:TMW65360.1 hypothetical protein Poli38472_008002 [Pythium oligandrum]
MRLSSVLGALAAFAAVGAHAQNTTATAFKYRTYSQIVDAIYALEGKAPQFVDVFSAQDRYGLPLRTELMCTRNGVSEPCRHYVIKITDESTLPDPQRPEVFFSGALHGDERVGPQSVTALAELLVDHATRADGNPWIKHLVKARTIVIMPTTNAYGYDKNTRAERSYDPNRDFNYGKGSTCFQTMVARAVNEVWRDHLFQLAITFHGGTQSVSYEWGSTNHELPGGGSDKSPDHQGQWYMGRGLSRFGGKFSEGGYYPDGPMNDIVYAVNGGMEDWAYAASWENAYTTPKPVGVCQPSTYGGYPAAKSNYNDATHRSFNILIETSNSKQPTESSLGNDASLSDAALADFLPATQTIGHVPRNVRIALMYIDLVQPYVQWKNGTESSRAGDEVTFNWEVLGAVTVDDTHLKISKTADFNETELTAFQTGVTRWYHPDMATSSATNKGLFKHSVTFKEPGTYYVQAVATVDQNWLKQGTGKDVPVPNVPPQTHVVNARTNPSWSYSNNGKTVQGQLEWASPVATIVVA